MNTQNTKHKLAVALKELMKTTPLEKITVKDIATECNLTRQTFYRNFEDKFSLLNWYFELLVHDSFVEMNTEKNMLSALKRKFAFIQKERVVFKCAFKLDAYHSLLEYDYRYILYSVYTSYTITKSHSIIEANVTAPRKLEVVLA